jgi:hypothetical protein
LSPKLYSRVARFQAALDGKLDCHNVRWVDLACEFGYHDQMHMIRDFQKLSGLSPECLLARLGDMRPAALASREPTVGMTHIAIQEKLQAAGTCRGHLAPQSARRSSSAIAGDD